MNQTVAIILLILLGIAIISFFINLYNKLVMLKFNVDKAYGNIDVVLKQRADEIPNLVTVAKHFMNYEEKLLTRLTELRTFYNNSTDADKRTELANETSKALSSFFAVSENYPELKSNNNFVELQKRISELEDKIADRREFFNDSVNLYNIGTHEFPNVILAKMLGYKDKTLLEITNSEKHYDGVQF
ncbi:LemA family protein [Chryseobacterium sp. MEBOG06]|uniref:LemA family protein n=1 Tax=Chryseobacterium sp. MEBOG06 TaxID=2879938 RepID=UPI001F1A1449|nr:LemA family protein [Chryseobacterium sp. MEBOG06]UKB82869.1 LemA family protein [Chryseobacterium sp. MEBOG06]